MNKVFLISAIIILASSCEMKQSLINGTSLLKKDDAVYLGNKKFTGTAAFEDFGRFFGGIKTLKRGDVCRVLIDFKNGKPASYKRFYGNTTELILIGENTFEIGVNVEEEMVGDSFKSYYENGNLKAEGPAIWTEAFLPKKNGKHTFYTEDGNIKREVHYDKGMEIKP